MQMIYASTRNTLTKSLGSQSFTSSIFATSKDDLTPQAYTAHLKHISAPPPLSAREQEIADARAAERLASGHEYAGAQRVASPLVKGAMGFQWSDEAKDAFIQLAEGEGEGVVIIVGFFPR
jgi:twinfilin